MSGIEAPNFKDSDFTIDLTHHGNTTLALGHLKSRPADVVESNTHARIMYDSLKMDHNTSDIPIPSLSTQKYPLTHDLEDKRFSKILSNQSCIQ